MHQIIRVLCSCVAMAVVANPAMGGESDDLSDVVSNQITVESGSSELTYYLIERKSPAEPPEDGFGLVIVLPGGDGQGGAFQKFMRRIHKYVLDGSWVMCLGVARKWAPDQQIVWPTRTAPVEGMAYTTEAYVDAVFNDVAGRRQVDKTRVILMGWSSGGPACYATSLSNREYITGYYILMSVFNPKSLPPVERARGRAYYIEHGAQDKTCPVWMARMARNKLKANGARVRYVEYEGGHGFKGPVYPRMKRAFRWLTDPGDAPSTAASRHPTTRAGGKALAGLLGRLLGGKARRTTSTKSQVIGWHVRWQTTPNGDGLIEIRTPIEVARP